MSVFLNEWQINNCASFQRFLFKNELKRLDFFEKEITITEDNVTEWIVKTLRRLLNKANFGFNYFKDVTKEGFVFDDRMLIAELIDPSSKTIEIIQNCLLRHRIMPKKVKNGQNLQMLWRISDTSLPPFDHLFNEVKTRYETVCVSVYNCALERWTGYIRKNSDGIEMFFTYNELYRSAIIEQVLKNAKYNALLRYVVGEKCVVATINPGFYDALIPSAQSLDRDLFKQMCSRINEFYKMIGFSRDKKESRMSCYYSFYIPDGTYEWAKKHLECDGFKVSYVPYENGYKYRPLNVITSFPDTFGLEIYVMH